MYFRSLVHPLCSITGLGLSGRVVDSELVKDDAVLHNRAQRAQQPGQRLDYIVGVLRVAEDAQAVCQVASERQEEEEKSESCAVMISLFALVCPCWT